MPPRRKPESRAIHIEVVKSTDLRLADWQASPNLVREGKRLLSDPMFQLAFAVLRNESPVNEGLPRLNVAPTDRIVHQSLTEGYHLVLNNIESLAIPAADETVQLEATFGAEEYQRLRIQPESGIATEPTITHT